MVAEKMDLDELQDRFGGMSKYQVGVIFFVSFLTFGTSFISQTSVFFSAVPDHRCSVPPLDDPSKYPNLTEENITSIMIPPGESCERYAYNLSTCTGDGNLDCVADPVSDVMECDEGWTYNDTYYTETTVSEWDLVCDDVSLDSLANSMYFVGIFFGSAIIGPLLDWAGRKLSMLIMCISVMVTGMLVAFSPTYPVYIAMRVLSAMAAVPCFVAYFTYVSEISQIKWRTVAGAYGNTVSALSHTVLPLIAYFIRDWRYLCICVSLVCSPYLVIYFFIPESPRWLLAKGREDEAKQIVSRYAKSKKQELSEEDWDCVVRTEREKIQTSEEDVKYTIWDLYRPPVMRMLSLNVIYLWFVTSMVFYGLTLNVGTLSGQPYVNSLLNGFVEIIGYLLVPVGVRLIGMRITCSLVYFLSGVCCLTTMLLVQFADGNDAMIEASRWVAILGKLFATSGFGIIYQYTTELYPTVARGTAMSMGSMSARIGSIIMPWTLQAQKAIPWLTQTIFGTIGVIAGFTSLLLPETRNADLMSSIDESENFYRREMKFTTKLMGRSGQIYDSHKSNNPEEGEERDNKAYNHEELAASGHVNMGKNDEYMQTSKL